MSGLAGLLSTGLLSACAGDSALAPGTAQLDLETGFWSLTVNHQAVTLSTVAPYDTLRLTPTARNARGVPLSGPVLDSVVTTYTLANPSDTSVTLTADGLMRARYTHTGSLVLVHTQVRGLTRVDTLLVNVTDTTPAPQAATLALTVTPDTSTSVFGGEGGVTVAAQVLDGGGTVIPHAAVHFRSDTTLVRLDVPVDTTAGNLQWRHDRPARVWVVAEATVYGVTVRDSVPATLTPPAFISLTAVFGTPRRTGSPVGYFVPAVDTLTVGTSTFGDVGAVVGFVNLTATPIDVVWDDPAAVTGSHLALAFCGAAATGNIAAFVAPAPGGGNCGFLRRAFGEVRVLPGPGTYHYHSALYGTGGTLVVVPR